MIHNALLCCREPARTKEICRERKDVTGREEEEGKAESDERACRPVPKGVVRCVQADLEGAS